MVKYVVSYYCIMCFYFPYHFYECSPLTFSKLTVCFEVVMQRVYQYQTKVTYNQSPLVLLFYFNSYIIDLNPMIWNIRVLYMLCFNFLKYVKLYNYLYGQCTCISVCSFKINNVPGNCFFGLLIMVSRVKIKIRNRTTILGHP